MLGMTSYITYIENVYILKKTGLAYFVLNAVASLFEILSTTIDIISMVNEYNGTDRSLIETVSSIYSNHDFRS